jgi:hypothetical protein
MKTMQAIVVESASQWQRGDDLPIVPFLLDSETEQAPTEFEIIFIAEQIRYQYQTPGSPAQVNFYQRRQNFIKSKQIHSESRKKPPLLAKCLRF